MPETLNSPPSLMHSLLRVAHCMEVRLEAELKAIGLSHSLFETLTHLAGSHRPLTMCELADGQGCAPSNITQKMDRLERDGLVKRVAEPADRRVVLAEITPLGREKALAGQAVLSRLKVEFEAGIPAAERETLARALANLG